LFYRLRALSEFLSFERAHELRLSQNEPFSPRRQILWIALLALLMRISFAATNGMLLLPDAYGRYLPVAERLWGALTLSPYDTPGYPVFLALCLDLVGPGFPLAVIQSLLDLATILLTWGIARRLIPLRAAFWIAVYLAIHPGAVMFASAVLSETLFTFLIVAATYLFVAARADFSPRRAVLLALFLVCAALTRANGVLAVVVFAGALVLSELGRRKWIAIACFLITAFLPLYLWSSYNQRNRGFSGLTQGSGWQWTQNLAYFELFDPSLLEPEEEAIYESWASLPRIHGRRMDAAYATGHPESVDPRWRALASASARQRPWQYVKAMPRALMMPRAFVKDVTQSIRDAQIWERHLAAVPDKYVSWMKPLDRNALINAIFRLVRKVTIFNYKYTVLVLLSVPVFFIALFRRNAHWLLITGLPLAQAAALTLMLNPIERYFYPFEGLMLCAAVYLFTHRRKGTVTRVSPDERYLLD